LLNGAGGLMALKHHRIEFRDDLSEASRKFTKSKVFAGNCFAFAKYTHIRSGDSEDFLKITSSRFAVTSGLAAWNGTLMIPLPRRAIWIRTSWLVDDIDPLTSTCSDRDAF
jgi:hypothetical protein